MNCSDNMATSSSDNVLVDRLGALLSQPCDDVAMQSLFNSFQKQDAPPVISRTLAHGLWTSAENESWNASTRCRALAKDMALCCVQHSAGEANYLHLKFVTEAHLSVGRLFGSDLVAVQQHLEAAQSALDALCALAGDGERWIRKTSELRFQCFLACSQILYDLGGDHKMMAHSFAKRAKELLPSVAELGADLGLFCYNCGVREHKAKQLESCVAWVQLSVDSFDRVQNVHNLCRSLRLLAASLMDMRQLEQAKKTAHLAMELDHGTAHTLAMLCRIHLAADETQVLEAALSRLLQVPDLTLTAGVDLCQELRSRGSLSLCAWALRQLADRFSHDPSLGLLCVEQLRLAVQTDREAALVLMNGFASKHHDGTVRLSAPVCSEMVRVCFDLGVKHRESATAWIGLAVSLAGSSSLENDGRAQLHRLLATVCLEANDVLSALSNAKSAVQLCSTAAAGYYLLARCLMIKDAKETSHALVQLASCKDFSPNMMFNLAAIAQSLGCTAVMIDALERFVSVVDVQSAAGLRDFVAASRALVRALGSVVPSGDFVDAARIVSTIFCKCREAGGWNTVFPDLPQHLEGEWAATAIYNLAGAALSNKCVGVASSLFDMASVVCSFQAATIPLVLPSRRLALMCFLDAAVSCTAEQIDHANSHLKALRLAGTLDKDELLLLEFRTALLDPAVTVSDITLSVSRLSALSSSPFLFERMASACLQPQQQSRKEGIAEAAQMALAAAFRLHSLTRPVANVDRAAAVVRNLAGLAVLAGAEAVQAIPLREMTEMAKTEPTWPLADRQYLSIEIWNLGAREWRRARLQQAESWCSLALGLAKFCGHNWPAALEMKASYGQLLASLASGAADSMLH